MKEQRDSGRFDAFRTERPVSQGRRSTDRREWTGVSPRVLRVIRGIHLLPGRRGGWEVRSLGSERIRRRFSDKSEALSFALAMQRRDGSDVIVHRPEGGSGVIKILEAEPRPEPRED